MCQFRVISHFIKLKFRKWHEFDLQTGRREGLLTIALPAFGYERRVCTLSGRDAQDAKCPKLTQKSLTHFARRKAA